MGSEIKYRKFKYSQIEDQIAYLKKPIELLPKLFIPRLTFQTNKKSLEALTIYKPQEGEVREKTTTETINFLIGKDYEAHYANTGIDQYFCIPTIHNFPISFDKDRQTGIYVKNIFDSKEEQQEMRTFAMMIQYYLSVSKKDPNIAIKKIERMKEDVGKRYTLTSVKLNK